MAELRAQLEGAVGTAYRIGDELGGGGMSRVFVAEDLALGRTVVIKVLHPELAAGVNAERFKREVQLAARLQHPHIVPVLSAGEVDGLPYYVMPFVKGETLGARLARGPLPVAEVVHVMGDVAKALAYAQSEHIVHRDIKPDNILVSGGAACVADFGIAKALSSSRRGGDGEGLTSIGTSLGTAGYMAPEQVAGDDSLDHRADIYALGCVAYELLTGASPFAGKSPQQMLAAHVLEQPASVHEKRPDAPPALADLVMRCLAKDPADRPQTGEEILAALDNISLGTTDAHSQVRKSRSRVAVGAMFAAVFAAVTTTALLVSRNRGPSANQAGVTLAVAPFEVLDPQLGLWKEGLVDVLSRNLDGAAGMHTVSPSAAIKKWDGRVGREEAAAFSKRVGAQIVVYGSLTPAGQGVVDAKVWVLDTRSSGAPVEMSARDSSSRMDRLSDSLSVKLLSAIGGKRSVASVRSLGSGSLPAIKAFLTGAQQFRRTRFDSAGIAFNEAISLDSTFAIAHAFLNQTMGWTQGSNADRVREAGLAKRNLRPGLSPLDSLMIVAVGQYWDQTGSTVANQHAAYGTLDQATQRYPNDALLWYLYGDLRFHRDPEFSDHDALRAFNRSIEADSGFVPSYIHAVELSGRYGVDVMMHYATAYFATGASDLDARGKRLAMAVAAPGGTTSPKVRAIIDTISPQLIQQAIAALTRLPDSAEAVIYLFRTALKRPDATEAKSAGARVGLATNLAARGHIKEAWDMTLPGHNYSAAEMVTLGLIPADSAVRAMTPWLRLTPQMVVTVAPVFAAARDTAALSAAIASLTKGLAGGKDVPENQMKQIAPYVLRELQGYHQLARGDSAGATASFEQLSDSLLDLPIDQFIRARLIARTDAKRALQMLTSKKMTGDIISVARELEIGRLAERVGDVKRAIDAFTYVAAEWQNTDSEPLRNAVRESRDALKRLDADGHVRAQLALPR